MNRPLALRTAAALTVLVLAAHLLLVDQAGLLTGRNDAPALPPVLQTRTLTPPPPPPPPPPAPEPVVPKPVAPKPVAPKPRPVVKPAAPQPPPEPSFNRFFDQNPPLASVESSNTATETVANSGVQPTPDARPVVKLEADGLPPGPPTHYTVPASRRLLYDVIGKYRGLNYSANGDVAWQHDGQHYKAVARISAFLVGSRSQTTEGDITPEGLAPRRFADQWRQGRAAHFDREKNLITFSANTPDAPLLPGAQDRLSLFVQIGAMLVSNPAQLAPGATVTIQTVGPRDAEPWLITAEGEERLTLPAGEITALKFSREPRKPYDLRLELWLAPAYQYLPVRIRLTQPDGDYVEQMLRDTEPLGDLQ